MNQCKCLLKAYVDKKGYHYVECVYCDEQSKHFKDVYNVLELKRENIKMRECE